MTCRMCLAAVAAGMVMAFAGCEGAGESAASPATPAPPPTAPPPPPTETWIGFADPARASLFEGGRVRPVVLVSGELLESPLRLAVEHNAPPGQLLVSDEVAIKRWRHGAVEIVGLEDETSEAAASYRITLLSPPEGLPPGVALAEAAKTFQVTLNDGDRQPGCSRLRLSTARPRFGPDRRFSTAQITLEGPRNVALRFFGPYWTDRLKEREDSLDLPIDPSDAPPITLTIPSSLWYLPVSKGGHWQRMSLFWYSADLRLAALVPGCEPVRVSISSDHPPFSLR